MTMQIGQYLTRKGRTYVIANFDGWRCGALNITNGQFYISPIRVDDERRIKRTEVARMLGDNDDFIVVSDINIHIR